MGSRSAVLGGGCRMRAVPLGHLVEPPLWSHEAADWFVDDARGRSHWSVRWSSLWSHEMLYWGGG
eukprot:3620862-Pyramimonas_sp.AAC.1